MTCMYDVRVSSRVHIMAAVAPNHNHTVHRACALYCIVAGAVLCIPGIALSAVGNDSTNESTRYSYYDNENNASHR